MGCTYEVSYWGRPESKWIAEQNQTAHVTVWAGNSFVIALWKLWRLKNKHPSVQLTWRR